MARKRGTYSLSANIEMLAGAPIDARSVVATKADLTANGSFPYPYIGMETYVVSENKKYKLIADDTTDSASWQELNTVSGLSDTSISSIADGNALEYDATAQKWKNVPKKAEDAIQKYTYSISDHGILAVGTTGQTDTISSGIDKLRTITIQAIADHVTWINGAIPPAPPANYTYTISDHDLLVAAAAPATDTITDWVGKIHTALTGIISDHKTWINSLPSSSGTVTSVAVGDGLVTASGTAITTSGTIKANLRSFTKLTNDSAAVTETSGRIYPVALDKSGYLSVNVPWEENDHEVYQERIKYNDSGANDNYYLLFSKSANFTSKTEYARKNSDLSYVPSESQLYVPNIYSSSSINSPYGILNINSINRTVQTGSGTAGSESSGTYYPAKWTLNVSSLADRAPIDGDTITIKIPVAGYSKGEYLSVDDGTTYYPVAKYGTARLNTEYDVGSIITLIFDSSASITAYAITGSSSSSTVTGGAWRVVNYYDTNTNTAVSISNTNPTSGTTYYPTWHTATSGTSVGLKANDGFKYASLQGTASAAGYGQLLLGNATSTGTAGNKRGSLVIYSEKSGYVNLKATASSTTARDITFPDAAGTVALTSDLSGYLPLSGGTMTGAIIMPASDTTGVIRPASNNYGQIGTSDYSFYNAYIYEIHVSSLCGIKNKTYINCYASLIPDTATTSRVLGSYDKPWYGLYTNGNIAVYKPSNIEWSLNGTNGEPSIIMNAANDKAFKFKYTSYGTNIDVGWDWNNVDGSGAFFRSVDSTLTAGSCGLYARSTSSNTTQITLNPGGDIVMEGTVRPNVNVTRDLGTSSYKFRYIYGHCNSNSTSNADYTSVTGYSEILGGVRHVYLKGTTTRAISSTYGNLKYSSTTMPIPSSLGWSVSGLYMVLSATVQAASGLNFCSVFSVTASSIGIFITAAQAESSKAYTVWVHLICAY